MYVCVCGTDLSLAVPVTNALTLVFTAVAGRLTGEAVALRTYSVSAAMQAESLCVFVCTCMFAFLRDQLVTW